ncbi:MAG: fatty acid desaturase [Planctomycetota bacterium]
MSTERRQKSEFTQIVKELHTHVKDDCFDVSALHYWGDLLLSGLIGWGAFAFALTTANWVLFTAAMAVASVLLYRAVAFTHELVHVSKTKLPGFHAGWHAVVGIPLLAPNFMYRQIHLDHHKKGHYSTKDDGEYLPFATSPVFEILAFLFSGLILPAMSLFRFSVLAPLSLLHPVIRKWVVVHASSIGVQMIFARNEPKKNERREWLVYETICSVVAITALALVATGAVSWWVLACWYMLVALIVTLNAIRAVGCTHFYVHDKDIPISLREQIEDSINVDSESLVTLILCPVGTRYHCLHHLFPTLPYHSLQRAHRRLMQELPETHFYRRYELPNVWVAWKTVWPNASQGSRVASQLQ